MYIRVSTGSSFSSAASYNEEGLSQQQKAQKAGKVALLGSFNMLSDDAAGIAGEMRAVASRSRTHQPVWNVSLSAADGQRLTDKQWIQAAEHYLRTAGADPDRHQYAIWRHKDPKHDHIHVLLNAVPMDNKPALKRYYNGKRAKEAAQKIDTLLAQPIKPGQGVRQVISSRIQTTLSTAKPATMDEFITQLRKEGVLATLSGTAGIRFQLSDQDHAPVKGSAVGYKFAHLVKQIQDIQAAAERQAVIQAAAKRKAADERKAAIQAADERTAGTRRDCQ